MVENSVDFLTNPLTNCAVLNAIPPNSYPGEDVVVAHECLLFNHFAMVQSFNSFVRRMRTKFEKLPLLCSKMCVIRRYGHLGATVFGV